MSRAMHILEDARRRFAVLSCEALVSEAIEILGQSKHPLAA
jgi:hypothetical protein